MESVEYEVAPMTDDENIDTSAIARKQSPTLDAENSDQGNNNGNNDEPVDLFDIFACGV